MSLLYLDNAATTRPDEIVIDAIMPYLTELWHNPSSLYSPSPKIKADIESARKVIADFVNANPSEICFTSGGSESNSWCLQGFVKNRLINDGDPCVVITSIEHKSIIDCAENLLGVHNWCVDVDENGFVTVDAVKEALDTLINKFGHEPKDILFSIGLANSEIGCIQNIYDIARLVHSYGCLIHVDAVAAFGKIPIDVRELDVDFMTCSAHKIHALKGCGFLYIRDSIEISPLIYGSQENHRRGGTENVIGIIALAKAVELIQKSGMAKPDMVYRVSLIRDWLIEKLEDIGCKLNGSKENRLPTNINVQLPNVSSEAMLYMLDLSEIQTSVGSACNSSSIKPSHVLKAIGLSDEEAASSLRITFESDIGIKECEDFVDELDRCCKLLRGETIDASILDVKY